MPARVTSPIVRGWQSRFGLVEEYTYAPGRAGALPVHAHRDVQLCLSLDFPGRYAYRGALHDVPAGAVSALDSWEPHAASDPFDRDRTSHYFLLYVDPVHFRRAIGLPPASPIVAPVRTDAATVRRFRELYDALARDASPMEQDERYDALASRVLGGEGRRASKPARASLLRARDFIAAHAAERIGVRDAAAQANLSPWHFVRAFRQHFGMPPHRFQLCMRIDLARRFLAEGRPSSEVAHATGFADQSHFTRSFKHLLQTTPARYGSRRGRRAVSIPEAG